MNRSYLKAWKAAKLLAFRHPNGAYVYQLREVIKNTIGSDKRTIIKYQKIMRKNGFIVCDNYGKWHASEYIDELKPKSLSEILEDEAEFQKHMQKLKDRITILEREKS